MVLRVDGSNFNFSDGDKFKLKPGEIKIEDIDIGKLFGKKTAPEITGEEKFPDLKEYFEKRLFGVYVNGMFIDDYIAELKGENDDKLTPEQREAKAELNKKESSIGIKYGDARAKIAQILEQYPDCYDEVEVALRPKDSNGAHLLVDIHQTKKIFNPDKLPEPARTEYKEAMASMNEIEHNNKALVEKVGINTDKKAEEAKKPERSKFDNLLAKLNPKEPTEKQKAARAKLDEKVSSTGVKYSKAKAKMESVKEKYKDDPNCRSMFEQEQPEGLYVYITPVEDFDPYKLPEPAKTEYFEALAAMQEIEETNSALVEQAGLEKTPTPKNPAAQTPFRLYDNPNNEEVQPLKPRNPDKAEIPLGSELGDRLLEWFLGPRVGGDDYEPVYGPYGGIIGFKKIKDNELD